MNYIKGILLEDKLGLGKTSVIYQDIVDASRGPADTKMPRSSTPEFRAAHKSEFPSSLRSVDFAVGNEQRVGFSFFSLHARIPSY